MKLFTRFLSKMPVIEIEERKETANEEERNAKNPRYSAPYSFFTFFLISPTLDAPGWKRVGQ